MTTITKNEFEKIAKAAAKNGNLASRGGKYGKEFAVMMKGRVVATATCNIDGNYEYEMHI